MNNENEREVASTVDVTVIRMTATRGMINIDGSGFSYANIQDMYKAGDGRGIQVDENLRQKQEGIQYLCGCIAAQVSALQVLLDV